MGRWLTEVAEPTPAVGHDFSLVPSATTHWRISSLFAQLVTSATVVNRLPHLVIKDPNGLVVANLAVMATIAAGAAVTVTWYPAAPSGPNGSDVYDGSISGPCPDGWFPPNYSISSLTTGLDGADHWSAILAVFELADAVAI